MVYKLTSTRVYRSYYGGANIDALMGVKYSDVTGESGARAEAAGVGVTRFPEDWLASVTLAFNPDRQVEGEGLSRTEDGRYLKDIIEANKAVMLGSDKEMKLLFKLLDAAERLVIQGHPTIPFAKEYFNSPYGKTECWYLLNNGGNVYLGFKPGITKEYWKQLFEKQDVAGMLDCLHHFRVKRGDMIFVEGGVPHAIGAGCFMAELQEPTDLMVIPERITPSGIVLKDEKLHGGLGFERMFDCFVYEGMEREEILAKYFLKPQKLKEGRDLLVGSEITDKFRLERMQVAGEASFEIARYGIVLITEGSGSINGQSVKAGDRLFVPQEEKQLHCAGVMELLFCSAT